MAGLDADATSLMIMDGLITMIIQAMATGATIPVAVALAALAVFVTTENQYGSMIVPLARRLRPRAVMGLILRASLPATVNASLARSARSAEVFLTRRQVPRLRRHPVLPAARATKNTKVVISTKE